MLSRLLVPAMRTRTAIGGLKLVLLTALAIGIIAAAAVIYFSRSGPSPGNQRTTTLPDGTVEYIYPTADMSPQIAAKVGQTFIVQLQSNGGSTGYDWNITTSAGIEYLNATLTSSSSAPGAPVTYDYFFKATQTGSQSISFQDMRQFSPYEVEATINAEVLVS